MACPDHIEGFANAAQLAVAIGAAAITDYGVAGPEYLRRLTELKPGALHDQWRLFEADFIKQAGAEDGGGQVLRVARRFALAALAGELATLFEITGWTTNDRLHGAAARAALWAFKAWLSTRGGLGSHEDREGIERVRLFIESTAKAASIGSMARASPTRWRGTRSSPKRAGWTEGYGVNQVWYVLPTVWRDEVCKGLNGAEVAKALAKARMLQRGEGNNLQCNPRLGELGKNTRVYVLTSKILDDGSA